MLCLSELHRKKFFSRIAQRISRSVPRGGIALEDLCDDRLAARLHSRSVVSHFSSAKTTEPIYLQSDFDCAEGGRGGSQRPAAMCRRHARRIHPASRPSRM